MNEWALGTLERKGEKTSENHDTFLVVDHQDRWFDNSLKEDATPNDQKTEFYKSWNSAVGSI